MGDSVKRASNDALATTVFGAALTLVAILMGVVAIFEGEVQTLTNQGLKEAAKTPAGLRDFVVAFLMICCWCAFWAYLYLIRWSSSVYTFSAPIGFVIIAIFCFVPYWIWMR